MTGTLTERFAGVDFIGFDGLLAEEERAVRDTVRTWVDDQLMPVIGKAYIEGRFPKQLIPGIAELGVLGANLPEEYGCAGLNNVAYGLIMQELERGDSGIRSFASVQGALVMYPIFTFGSEEQKQRWLPRLAAGQEIGCFGLTEPDFGSNPGGMLTTARQTADGWVLNSSCRRTRRATPRRIKLGSFLFEPRTRARSTWRTFGFPATRSCPSRAASRARSCV